MKAYRLKKSLAAILCVCFVMASFLSVFFIITHECHDCTGNDCVVCYQLENAKSTLQQLCTGIANNTSLLPVLAALILCISACFPEKKTASLVTLKIRMDN